MTSQCTKRWLASFIFERKLQCICWRKLPDLEASEMICTINLKQHCVKQRIGSLLFFMVCLFVCYVCLFDPFQGLLLAIHSLGFLFCFICLLWFVWLLFVCLFVFCFDLFQGLLLAIHSAGLPAFCQNCHRSKCLRLWFCRKRLDL